MTQRQYEELEAQVAASQVDHPSHYKNGKYRKECIEAMVEVFGQEKVNIFAEISAFKYLWRKGDKANESEDKDLRKAQWYDDYVHNHKDAYHEVQTLTAGSMTIGDMLKIINDHYKYSPEELELLKQNQ